MNGGNVIDDNFKESSVKAQLDNISQLLNASSVKYYTCVDRKTSHKKIVIEYGHATNDDSVTMAGS